MSQRMNLKKRKKPISKWKCFLLSVLIAFLMAFFLVLSTGRKLEKIIVNYATIETKRIATTILNQVIHEELEMPSNSLYTITKDSDGNIQLIDFNTQLTNEILSSLNEKATSHLLALEAGDTTALQLSNGLEGTNLTFLDNGVVCEIPLGVLLKNALLVNLSAVVPIRFSFIGTVTSHLNTKVTSYGINNALVEITVEVTITEQITMPHTAQSVTITSEIPLSVELIQGKVPSFYQGSLDRNSNSLSLPLEENS